MPKRNDPNSQSQAEGDKEYSIGFHEQDYMSEAPSTMRTTVSTVYEDNMGFGMTEGDDFDSDNRSDTGFSQTYMPRHPDQPWSASLRANSALHPHQTNTTVNHSNAHTVFKLSVALKILRLGSKCWIP
jgi:hypothetical protein